VVHDWSAQSAHVSARSRLYSEASSSAAMMVLRSLAEMMMASGPGALDGSAAVGSVDGC
jgi:hypothetical protein